MRTCRAFTLIELLAVLVILGVLAAVIVPSVASVRAGVDRARTKVMFNQWALACAQFRQEYGFLPLLGVDHRLATMDDSTAFVRVLSGRNPDGTVVSDPAMLGGNTRRLAFYTPGATELRNGVLADAFGNTEMGVMVDRDGDGWVRPGIDGVVPGVRAADGSGPFTPDANQLPATGVRAEVIFFSAGRGRSAADLVLSWQ
jgi:prepilin-type N-terminal cleavage/methylation domain-containing protein